MYNPTIDMAILGTYLGTTIYKQKVKTIQSTIPNKSPILPAITGIVAIDNVINKLAANKLISIGAYRFFSAI